MKKLNKNVKKKIEKDYNCSNKENDIKKINGKKQAHHNSYIIITDIKRIQQTTQCCNSYEVLDDACSDLMGLDDVIVNIICFKCKRLVNIKKKNNTVHRNNKIQ